MPRASWRGFLRLSLVSCPSGCLVDRLSQQSQIQRNLPLKIGNCGVRRPDKIDHPDRPETTEGHHADHNTNDIGSDQRGEDEGQRAARTPRYRPRNGRHSVDRSRDCRACTDARGQDAAR